MLFDSTLRKDMARGFGATVVVILTTVLTMMLIRTLGQAAVGQLAPQDVVLFLGFAALASLPTMLALSMFIAVVATLSRLYRDSEMTIWFASGVGLTRFVRPVLRTGLPVILAIAALALVVYPWVNLRSAELKERYDRRSDISRVAAGQFQTSADGSRTFFIDRDSQGGSTGRNVLIVSNQAGREAVTTARQGRMVVQDDERVLLLESGQRNDQDAKTGEKTLARFEEYRVVVGDRVAVALDTPPPKARTSLDLLRHPEPQNLGEMTWRIGLVLGSANLLLLAIPLSAQNPRRASNWNLLMALLAFIVYYNLINLSQAWVATGRTGMGEALAAVHGGGLVLAIGLIIWRESSNRSIVQRRPPVRNLAAA